MLPIENDHLPEKMPIADASADDRRQRDSDAAKLRSDGVQGKRRAKKDPEARKTGTLTLDKRG